MEPTALLWLVVLPVAWGQPSAHKSSQLVARASFSSNVARKSPEWGLEVARRERKGKNVPCFERNLQKSSFYKKQELYPGPQRSSLKNTRLVSVNAEFSGETPFLRDLGEDVLTYLGTTVLMVPAFKKIKQSPVLGFLLAGFLLKEFHLFQENQEISTLSELGVQFLLFDMGLELTVDRLKALAKYAFGMGIPQILLTTGLFASVLLPAGNAWGTRIIEQISGVQESFLNIYSVDEALVIGLALSLSSSAFVLQILGERGQLATKFGAATLGVLLMQDIAVVPLLAALPALEKSGVASIETAGSAIAKAMLGLGILVLASRLFLRRIFEVVAQTRSSETFVALCIFTVTGIASLTSRLGFSDTLGAFLAGVLLADTNYKAQVEADLRPFKGLLLGLFFVTTGARVEKDIVISQWPVILTMLTGLFSIKTALTALCGRAAGLSPPDAIRTGFLLSQGGEFAFVVLSLAQKLGVLPEKLNRVLVIVVIISLFATPSLSQFGAKAANFLEERQRKAQKETENVLRLPDPTLPLGQTRPDQDDEVSSLSNPVIICGFGRKGQVLASLLSSPLNSETQDYIAVDYDPLIVDLASKEGFNVVYGEASPRTIASLGIGRPRAIVITYNQVSTSINAVSQLRSCYPEVPIYATARDMRHASLLKEAGVESTTVEINQNALALVQQVLSRVSGRDISRDAEFDQVFQTLLKDIEARAEEIDWEDDGSAMGTRNSAKDLYVYGGAIRLVEDELLPPTPSKLDGESSSNNTSSTST